MKRLYILIYLIGYFYLQHNGFGVKSKSKPISEIVSQKIITTENLSDKKILIDTAEKFYNEKSYSLAIEKYLLLKEKFKQTIEESNWLEFRLADSQWRKFASIRKNNHPDVIEARKKLQNLGDRLSKIDNEKPKLLADVYESLGDSWWKVKYWANWHEAWRYYNQALDWWAASTDLVNARKNYLRIVWKASSSHTGQAYNYYGNILPIAIIENILKLTETDTENARAHFLMAMALKQNRSRSQSLTKVSKEFKAAIKLGKKTEWYDDALFYYAQWTAQYGHYHYDENGDLQLEADYEKALSLYRKIGKSFNKGESKYFKIAKNEIKRITKSKLNLVISHAFPIGSQPQFNVIWRNLDSIKVEIFQVNLTENIHIKNSDKNPINWMNSIDTDTLEVWDKLTLDKKPLRPHYENNEDVQIKKEIPIGAYLVVASSGGKTTRDILIVSNSILLLKTTNKKVVGFFCDAITGAPIGEANIVLLENYYKNKNWVSLKHNRVTNANGLFEINFEDYNNNRRYLAFANSKNNQAFALSNSHWNSFSNSGKWKIYAYTDRPAYRPGETVNWKAITRKYSGGQYYVSDNEKIHYQIVDARGNIVSEGSSTTNQYGSIWGELNLTKEMQLGSYRINFKNSTNEKYLAGASLFRLEEYKLPEFKGKISIGSSKGKKPKSFQIGDVVSGNVNAEYYFGGSVSSANVKLIIYQKPFNHWWHPQRNFDWYYDKINKGSIHRHFGKGTVVKELNLKTDSTGNVTFTFETPQYSDQDYEYIIEARITDSSRREIIVKRSIKVTRQSYYVYLNLDHNIYKPNDEIKLNIKTLDANNRPVSSKGRIRITQERWHEVWTDHRGREISDAKLNEIKKKSDSWFYFGAAPSDYRLKSSGYKTKEIDATKISTNNMGEAEYSFSVQSEGFYKIHWISRMEDGQPIKKETPFYVSTDVSTDIGYRPGGVKIIVDKETFKVGNKVPVMLSTPTSNKYVLFSAGANELVEYRLIQIDGTAKLIYLDITEKFVPNCFLDAHMVSNRELFFDNQQIIIPPTKNFLNIEITPDDEGYQPHEKGLFTIKVTDDNGMPVATELSLGVTDEAIYYIQPDISGDIKKFFYGNKRRYGIQTTSSFNQKQYLIKAKDIEGKEFDKDYSKIGNKARRSMVAKSAVLMSAPQHNLMAESLHGEEEEEEEEEEKPSIDVSVRTDFRKTVFWQPSIVTDENGIAKVKVEYPDSLTTWKAIARGVALENKFGMSESETKTRLPLIVRLQAPRFFVVGDQVTLSGIFNNNTAQTQDIDAMLEVEDNLEILGINGKDEMLLKDNHKKIKIAPHSEIRVDWIVSVKKQGDTKLKITGLNKDYSDAMEKIYPVYEHGIVKFTSVSGKSDEKSFNVNINIPKERKEDSTKMTINVSPSIAITMLDALPYLLDYPYGCTEQTMSRFLPAVIVSKTLQDLGQTPETIAGKLFGGIEETMSGTTHPGGKKDLSELHKITQSSLERLYDFQHSNGAWGWWKKSNDDPFMTAYVVWGLNLAKKSRIKVDKNRLKNAYGYLDNILVNFESNYDLQAWILHALSTQNLSSKKLRPSKFAAKAFLNLMKNRDLLNDYTRALLALSAHNYGFTEDASLLINNLKNGVKIDLSPEKSKILGLKKNRNINRGSLSTAHWGADRYFTHWSQGGVETTAFVLMALLTIDPNNELIEPAMNWLVKNRRGAQWNNTRDTALTILALNNYLKKSNEIKASGGYKISVNGQYLSNINFDYNKLLETPNAVDVNNSLIINGENKIQIERFSGESPVYYSINTEFFSKEEPISSEGNEIFVKRNYYRISTKPTLLKGYISEKEILNDNDKIKSGDRIEVVITVEAKNNYEYLIFEDLKPAGFETVKLRSGGDIFARELSIEASPSHNKIFTGKTKWVYQELRDRKVISFIDHLPEGIWEINYTMRAESPGYYHALPLIGKAMYIPEIKANSDELRLKLE